MDITNWQSYLLLEEKLFLKSAKPANPAELHGVWVTAVPLSWCTTITVVRLEVILTHKLNLLTLSWSMHEELSAVQNLTTYHSPLCLRLGPGQLLTAGGRTPWPWWAREDTNTKLLLWDHPARYLWLSWWPWRCAVASYSVCSMWSSEWRK